MTKPCTYCLAFSLAIGVAVACGDEHDGAGDDRGKGASGGSLGKGGGSGKGGSSGASGEAGDGGSSGVAGSAGTGGAAGRGGAAGTSGSAGTGGAAGTSGSAGTGGARGGQGGSESGGEGGDSSSDCTPASLRGAPSITVTTLDEPLPVGDAVGGAVESGTYFATEEDVYQGGAPDARTAAVVVFDTVAGTFKLSQDNSPPAIGTYSTSGSTLTLTRACGSTGQISTLYMFGVDEFFTYDTTHNRVDTWTKQ